MNNYSHEPGEVVDEPKPEAPQQTAASTDPAAEHHIVTGSHRRFNRLNDKLILLAVVLLCAVAGTIYLLVSHADAPAPPALLEAKPTFQAAVPNPPYVPGAVLLKFKAGVPQAVQDKLIARYGSIKKEIPQIGIKVLTVPEEARDAVIEALNHNPVVEFAEKDAIVQANDTTPNDPNWQTAGISMTQANKAWDINTGSANVVIAILDTGVSTVPLDLQNKVLGGGYDFINNDNDPTDDNWHGTSVASVAAAETNNAIGMAGLCWGCKILPIKVMDSNGGGTFSTLMSGITYAADHGAKIVNMSLAGSGTLDRTTTRSLNSAISYAKNKGLSLYAAAGNSSSSAQAYPAASSGVIGVAGTNNNDSLYSWSDYGSWVKVAAPGCTQVVFNMEADRYGNGCGTSFATPVVAGIAGLLWSAKPAATASQVEQAILNNTDPCCGGNIGGGRVNALKAMQALVGVSTGPDTILPTVAISSPPNTAILSGQVNVSVTATDNIGVTKVEIYRNGILYATSTASPYNFFWDTTTSSNGAYTLTAKAYDAAGNVSASTVNATVSNTATTTDTTAPVATIISPVNGATVSSKVTITATATDNVGVSEMDVYIDGVLKTTSISGSVSYDWNTNGKNAKGQHTITVKAYDAAGNVGVSTITVTK